MRSTRMFGMWRSQPLSTIAIIFYRFSTIYFVIILQTNVHIYTSTARQRRRRRIKWMNIFLYIAFLNDSAHNFDLERLKSVCLHFG